MNDGDHRVEIVQLEAQIDELTARIESCRKFILAGRIAVSGGGVVLIAGLVGAIQFDPKPMSFTPWSRFFTRRTKSTRSRTERMLKIFSALLGERRNPRGLRSGNASSHSPVVALRGGVYTDIPISMIMQGRKTVDVGELYDINQYKPKVRHVAGPYAAKYHGAKSYPGGQLWSHLMYSPASAVITPASKVVSPACFAAPPMAPTGSTR